MHRSIKYIKALDTVLLTVFVSIGKKEISSAVPNWAWVEHVAAEDTYFFTTNDLPIMEKFDVEKREAYDKNNGQQEVTSEFKPLLP